MVYLFYTTHISVDLAHQVIFHAKVGKGGISRNICDGDNASTKNIRAIPM